MYTICRDALEHYLIENNNERNSTQFIKMGCAR